MRYRTLRPLLLLALLGLASALPAQPPSFLGRPPSQWVADLSSRDARVRRGAAFALGQLGEQAASAVPALVRALGDPDPRVREGAARAVGQIRRGLWQEAVLALCHLLSRDDSAIVKQSAACALGHLAEVISANEGSLAATVQAHLLKALTAEEPGVRQNAAWALGQFGPKVGSRAAAELLRLLEDSDELVRRDAVGALGALGQKARAAVDSLLGCYQNDPEAVVRQAALTALVNVVGPEDQAVGAVLRPALRDSDPEQARAAAFALANIGGVEAAEAAPVLCEALQDADPQVRRLAVAALLRLGPHAADTGPALQKALRDREPAIRRAAALALGRLGSKATEAIPGLLDLLENEKDEDVRTCAAEALAVMSPAIGPAVPTLQRLVQADRNWQVRVKAVIALGRLEDMGGRESPAILDGVLHESDAQTRLVRYNAAVVLALHLGPRVSDKALDTLAALMEDRQIQTYAGADASVRSAGAESGGGEATIRRKYSGDGRVLAARALAQVGPRAARADILRSLETASQEAEVEVRDVARAALARIRGSK